MGIKVLKFLAAIAVLNYLIVSFIPYGTLINAAVYLYALWNLINND